MRTRWFLRILRCRCRCCRMRKMDRRQLGRLVKLSWLSPSIIERIHAGDIPRGLTRSRLLEADLLLDWDEQERTLGFC